MIIRMGSVYEKLFNPNPHGLKAINKAAAIG
jgi:hypothetical protein